MSSTFLDAFPSLNNYPWLSSTWSQGPTSDMYNVTELTRLHQSLKDYEAFLICAPIIDPSSQTLKELLQDEHNLTAHAANVKHAKKPIRDKQKFKNHVSTAHPGLASTLESGYATHVNVFKVLHKTIENCFCISNFHVAMIHLSYLQEENFHGTLPDWDFSFSLKTFTQVDDTITLDKDPNIIRAQSFRLPLHAAVLISPIFLLSNFSIYKYPWERDSLLEYSYRLGNMKPEILLRVERLIWTEFFSVYNNVKTLHDAMTSLVKNMPWGDLANVTPEVREWFNLSKLASSGPSQPLPISNQSDTCCLVCDVEGAHRLDDSHSLHRANLLPEMPATTGSDTNGKNSENGENGKNSENSENGENSENEENNENDENGMDTEDQSKEGGTQSRNDQGRKSSKPKKKHKNSKLTPKVRVQKSSVPPTNSKPSPLDLLTVLKREPPMDKKRGYHSLCGPCGKVALSMSFKWMEEFVCWHVREWHKAVEQNYVVNDSVAQPLWLADPTRSTFTIVNHSIKCGPKSLGKRLRSGTLAQVLQCATMENGKILNALDLPMPTALLEESSFMTDLVSWRLAMGELNCPRGEEYPTTKWWIIATPKEGFEHATEFAHLEKGYDTSLPCPDLWNYEAILLTEGMMLMKAMMHCFNADGAVTNNNTPVSRLALQHMLSFFHTGLVKQEVHHESKPACVLFQFVTMLTETVAMPHHRTIKGQILDTYMNYISLQNLLMVSDPDIIDLDEALIQLHQNITLFNKIRNTRYFNPREPIPKAGNIHLAFEYAENPNQHHLFVQMLRVSPLVFNVILELIKDHLVFHNSHRPQKPIKLQLAVTLYRLGRFGNGASVHDVAQVAGCSPGAVMLYTHRCFIAITSLHDMFVRPLTDEEKEKEKEWVDSKMGFQGLWREGWVMYDGTIIPLAYQPSSNGAAYFTRKHNYGLNLQVGNTPSNLRIRPAALERQNMIFDGAVAHLRVRSEHCMGDTAHNDVIPPPLEQVGQENGAAGVAEPGVEREDVDMDNNGERKRFQLISELLAYRELTGRVF
ncbi:hypothetical protein BJ165DRAFT_1410751 [Panaeolus papilionaceus]|nr:hypothetical protein BJ165DRAFT_1410751 [Panaeolus papilionaceus]